MKPVIRYCIICSKPTIKGSKYCKEHDEFGKRKY